jgi:group I intron endonuclease
MLVDMVGIYKITNPKGKVYIGQSTNIEERMKHYINKNGKRQPKIFYSIKKYGWENHIFTNIK